ncbi:hypothetical protein [Aquipseudomonas alcaligenes]|uniref:Uncharacterized protein n=1 Tax=Aquipseudomonas alcaligenes TaxID=43263 RepID=A0A1N6WN45_AQUAC|nr:hypothetical protein [Pseudomonas alcaligenes]SIQ91442.1 hypothetical protein SAMN05878282_11080 [Pseudomonas alcaligenes]
MTAVASFFASLSFRTERASLKRVDRDLLAFEKKLAGFNKRITKSLTIEVPALKIKKFEFNTLSLQKETQKSLNLVGRLVQLPISNFYIDEAKLTKQVQGVVQRAANRSRINVRSIQGSSGGSNPYYPSSPIAQGFGVPNIPGSRSFLSGVPSLGFPLAGGIAGGVAGAALGLGVAGGQAVLNNRDTTQAREVQLTQLNAAANTTDVSARLANRERFFNLNNELGANASANIDSYSKLLKQLQATGLDNNTAFSAYANLLKGIKGTGGNDFQLGNAAYALQQTAGLGYLRGEELNQQFGDAFPSFKKYIQEVYAESTGNTGAEAFNKALSNRQVTLDLVFKALERAAQDVTPRLKEYSSTLESERNRLANLRLAEEIERASVGPVADAGKALAKSQMELFTATAPLRQAFDQLTASSLNAGASFTSFLAKIAGDNLRGVDSRSISRNVESIAPAAVGGLLGPAGLLAGATASGYSFFTRPELPQVPRFEIPSPLKDSVNQNKIPEAYKLNNLAGQYSPSNTVNIGDVNLTLNSTATNGRELLEEVRPAIRQEMSSIFQKTLSQYSQKE